MPLTVKKLLRLLENKAPDAEVRLAVEGFESAPLKATVLEAGGVLMLSLAAGSEVAQVLDECDILRW